jgi:NADH-quinone oxidoreductase subunit C
LPSVITCIPFDQNHRLRLRVWVEDPEEGPETVSEVWAIATWLEMEVYDLMGIRFQGNHSVCAASSCRKIGRDTPCAKITALGYEEVQFSFNWQEIDAKKPYAKD